MKSIFKQVIANLITLGIVFGLMGAALFSFLIVISLSAQPQTQSIKNNSVLVIDLDLNISDAPPEDSFSVLIDEAMGRKTKQTYLLELTDAIDQAREDARIGAIYLQGSLISQNYGSGYAALKELRRSLKAFVDSGKPIYAYAVSPSLRDYYVMSAADTIFLNPMGLLTFNGMATETVFFGNAFEQYGIGVQTTKAGKFKSAVETFTNNQMSEESRYQTDALLAGLWTVIKNDISESREIEIEQLEKFANEPGFFTTDQAIDLGLADTAAYLDEVITAIQDKHGSDKNEKSFQQVSLQTYIQTIGIEHRNLYHVSENQIAIVYAEGHIVDGEGEFHQVGGDRLARRIRALRKDVNVKGMVLRVNSPGGSAVAAEIIQREVREFQKEKPLVVSMGSLAASGGYWIAVDSDKIYAEPSTITGSIGVFGMLFNVESIANNWGITFDGSKTSKYSDIFTISRPKTAAEMAIIQSFTDQIYKTFLEKVANGRGLELDTVKSVAEGRVWAGSDAAKIGLVDEMGGLWDAVEHVAELAELNDGDWKLKQVPEKKDLAKQIESLLAGNQNTDAFHTQNRDVVESTLETVHHQLSILKSMNDPKGVYARMPFDLQLK